MGRRIKCAVGVSQFFVQLYQQYKLFLSKLYGFIYSTCRIYMLR